jgi:hypothetical protein
MGVYGMQPTILHYHELMSIFKLIFLSPFFKQTTGAATLMHNNFKIKQQHQQLHHT